MAYTIERVFHPVGQGAFYSEKHSLQDGREITIVYDCGSTKCKNFIKQRIQDYLHDGEVDLLFLSHFHSDHYKGIEFLKPKFIVLPLLDQYDKAIFWISNKLKITSNNYLNNIKDLFPDSTIIHVQMIGTHSENNSEADTREIDSLDNDSIIDSGTKLYFSQDGFWHYIPVNPKLDQSITSRFEILLDIYGLEKNKILHLDNDYFNEHKRQLKRIYKEIGSPNEYSMAVYSGRKNNLPTMHIWFNNFFPLSYRNLLNLFFNRWDTNYNPGCLYLGDINLKEPDDIESNTLKTIYSCLPDNVNNEISTIQVPHHGSIDNYNNSILSYYSKIDERWYKFDKTILYLISVGNNNPYHHPSGFVISKLMNSLNYVHVVTECSTTIFIEKWIYNI